MRILGIDPGTTSGWVVYDTAGFVVASGQFAADKFHSIPFPHFRVDAAVIERPVAHGPTRPQVVDCAWVAGQLWRDMWSMCGREVSHTLTRLQVRQALTAATSGVCRVVNDSSAWAALVLLHGDGADRKPKRKKGVIVDQGGVLGEVKGHARAALALAYAWSLRVQDAK